MYYLSVEFSGTAVRLVYDCRTTFNLPITSWQALISSGVKPGILYIDQAI